MKWRDQLSAGDRLVIPSAREIKSIQDRIGRSPRTGSPARRGAAKSNSAIESTAAPCGAATRPSVWPDSNTGRAIRARSAEFPPSSPDGGWVPAQPSGHAQPIGLDASAAVAIGAEPILPLRRRLERMISRPDRSSEPRENAEN